MNILTKEQLIFLNHFKLSELAKYFYLTGGTALSAFYLKHRYSYDLDFFTEEKESLDINNIIVFLKSIPNLNSISYEKIYDRRIFFININGKNLKIEFTFYPFKNIAKRITADGLNIDSFEDIFVNKIAAISDRKETKDLIDLYFILEKKGVSYILWGVEKAKEKFGIDGLQYIIQRRLINPPENLEDIPYLIKPIRNYRKLFEKAVIELTKRYFKE